MLIRYWLGFGFESGFVIGCLIIAFDLRLLVALIYDFGFSAFDFFSFVIDGCLLGL